MSHYKYTIEDMQFLARNRGGVCLSKEYEGCSTSLRWCCHYGHKWDTPPVSIIMGSWCRICSYTRLNTDMVREFAGARNGLCYDEYVNNHTPVVCKCDSNHIFSILPVNLLRGFWCPYCGMGNTHIIICSGGRYNTRGTSVTIEDCQAHAKKLGGECLSEEVSKQHAAMHWRCKNGHKFHHKLYGVIYSGLWCSLCGKTHKNNLKDAQELAGKKGGKCLSGFYTNGAAPMMWECDKGHQWIAPYHDVRGGHWCSECYGNAKKSLATLRAFAEENNGKLLSTVYINTKTPLKWECWQGHQFERSYDLITQVASFCLECSSVYTVEHMQKLAFSRGGKFLSPILGDPNDSQHEWECGDGHTWKTAPSSVVSGSWCMECCRASRNQKTWLKEEKAALLDYYDTFGGSYGSAARRFSRRLGRSHESIRAKLAILIMDRAAEDKVISTKVECHYCGKMKRVPPTFARRRKTHYCNQGCLDAERKKERIYTCQLCGVEFLYEGRKNKRDKMFCNKCHESGDYKRGSRSSAWKGGLFKINGGYSRILPDGKKIAEHRYVMEQSIGRKITRSENVIHIDGNKLNNEVSNLKLIHRRDIPKKPPRKWICEGCGIGFEATKKQKHHNRECWKKHCKSNKGGHKYER